MPSTFAVNGGQRDDAKCLTFEYILHTLWLIIFRASSANQLLVVINFSSIELQQYDKYYSCEFDRLMRGVATPQVAENIISGFSSFAEN